jgi:hypothetical protein
MTYGVAEQQYYMLGQSKATVVQLVDLGAID